MIEVIEKMIIDLITLYVLVKNVIYLVKVSKCKLDNWEVAVPPIMIAVLMLVFRLIDSCLDIPQEIQHAIRRGITIVTMSTFAWQVNLRKKCLQ